jgi:DNA-binding transcriptional MerR regulator
MADEGMTMPAIRRIIQLEQQLAEIARHRDELAARLAEVSEERARLARQLTKPLPPAGRDGNAHRDRDDRDDRDRDRAFEPGPRRDEE